MRQLSELDASFLYLESAKTPMHIGGIYAFDASDCERPLTFETFVAYLHSRLHLVPFFRQKLLSVPFQLDRPYWVDDPDFRLENHLAYVKLAGQKGLSDLMALTASVIAEPLKRDRPLWHISFVDGLTFDDKPESQGFALIVRIHHAAIDAFSGEEIMSKLLEYSAEPQPIARAQRWAPDTPPTPRQMLLQATRHALRKPWQFASLLTSAAEMTLRASLAQHLRNLPTQLPFTQAPRSPFNRNVTSKRQIFSVDLPLARLKAIKARLMDVTLNDVVLGVCAEALRRYLEAQNEASERPLIAMTPVSVRSKSLRSPTGNQMSAMLLSLATDEPNPARRIRLIHQNAVMSETYQKAIAADRLTELLTPTMVALSARLYAELQLAQRYQPVFNIPITNVPGPQVPLYLQGAKLIHQFNSAPLFNGLALVMLVVSYEGKLTFNMTLCPDVVPQAEQLPDLINESLQAIETALVDLLPETEADLSQQIQNEALMKDVLRYCESLFGKALGKVRKIREIM